ncbi:MAG: hypothetical protein QOJ56_4498 [Mycobacterium sp.]|nr:hypothetical protein [Mycobacterium sp.]
MSPGLKFHALLACDRWGQLGAFDDASPFEFVKALGQQICRDARQLRTQVAVAARTSDELAHDQQCPTLTEHVEPIGNRTVLVVVAPTSHAITLSFRQILKSDD